MKSPEHCTLADLIESAAERFEDADLTYGHGTSNPLDEAIFMVMEALGFPIEEDQPLALPVTPAQQTLVENVVAERIKTRKPAAYILNKSYMHGVGFYVDERVIIPRSYIAEMLFDEDSVVHRNEPARVLDLCTGSGCLAILAAHVFPEAQIDAVELSPDAAGVAEKNIRESGFADRLTLYRGDLFAPVKGKKYDLIITNPPYVDAQAMRDLPGEYLAEPRMALAGGEDGMDLVHKILQQALAHLNPGGGLLCEIGEGKDALESKSDLPFLWLDTQESSGEVFWITAKQLKK